MPNASRYLDPEDGQVWSVRERGDAYTPVSAPELGAKALKRGGM
jgi:hypothetical protein